MAKTVWRVRPAVLLTSSAFLLGLLASAAAIVAFVRSPFGLTLRHPRRRSRISLGYNVPLLFIGFVRICRVAEPAAMFTAVSPSTALGAQSRAC